MKTKDLQDFTRCIFTYHNGYASYRVKIENVATVTDEPYAPGGMLRVMRDKEGRILAGPLVSELTSWSIE